MDVPVRPTTCRFASHVEVLHHFIFPQNENKIVDNKLEMI